MFYGRGVKSYLLKSEDKPKNVGILILVHGLRKRGWKVELAGGVEFSVNKNVKIFLKTAHLASEFVVINSLFLFSSPGT